VGNNSVANALITGPMPRPKNTANIRAKKLIVLPLTWNSTIEKKIPPAK
jgi:hypothetical protein